MSMTSSSDDIDFLSVSSGSLGDIVTSSDVENEFSSRISSDESTSTIQKAKTDILIQEVKSRSSRVMLLMLLLFVLLVVPLVLISGIAFFYRNRSFRNNVTIETEVSSTKDVQEYSLFGGGMIFNDKNGQVYKFGEEEEYVNNDQDNDEDEEVGDRVFEVEINIHCCPKIVQARGALSNRSEFEKCHMVSEGFTLNMVVWSEDDIETNLKNQQLQLDVRGGDLCLKNEIVVTEHVKHKEVKPAYFCQGRCRANLYDDFISKNPEVIDELRIIHEIEDEEDTTDDEVKEYFKTPFSKISRSCNDHRSDGEVFRIDKVRKVEEVRDFFLDRVLSGFCTETRIKLKGSTSDKMFGHICVAEERELKCQLHVLVSIGKLRLRKES